MGRDGLRLADARVDRGQLPDGPGASKSPGPSARRGILLLALTANLGLLAWFKYAGFLAENASALGNLLGIGALEISPVHLPIGISFFTFQALSYVIDVYRGKTRSAAQSRRQLALYISLFPQLIAGPIVRYRDIAAADRAPRPRAPTALPRGSAASSSAWARRC